MEKDYELQIYTYAGAFVKTIERENITSKMSFSGAINAGNGELKLQTDVNEETSIIEAGHICKVQVFSDNYPDGKVVYTGVCTIREYSVGGGGSYYDFTFLGMQYLLSKLFYKPAGSFTGTATGTPGQIIKDIIDAYNAAAGFSWFSTDDIDLTGSSMNIAIDYTYCLDAITTAAKTRDGYYLYVDGSGSVHFEAKSGTADHILTVWDDTDSVVMKKDLEEMRNGIIVTWSGGTRPELVDAPSQAAYFKSQIKITDTKLNSTDTADATAATYLTRSKNPTNFTKVVVNSEYIDGEELEDGGIEELIPGDTVSILNTDETISNLQIYKIKYDIHGIELELEAVQTLGFLLSK